MSNKTETESLHGQIPHRPPPTLEPNIPTFDYVIVTTEMSSKFVTEHSIKVKRHNVQLMIFIPTRTN